MDGFDILHMLAIVFLVGLGVSVAAMYQSGKVADAGVILSFVFGILLLATVIFWGAESSVGMSCENKADNMGLRFNFAISSSCMVEVHGRVIDIDSVRKDI